MGLKSVVTSLDGLADHHKALYKEQGGVFVLDVDGVDDHPTVKGLKSAFETVKADKQTLKSQLEKFNGMSADDIAKLQEQARNSRTVLQIRGKEIKSEDDVLGIVNSLLQERVTEATKAWDAERTTLTNENKTLKSRLSTREIDAVALEAAAKFGVRKTAIPDVIARTRSVFQLTDDGVVAKDGDKVLYGKDPNKPMTMDEYMEKLATEQAPHLFEGSTGGGASGSNGSSRGSKTIDRNDPVAFGKNLKEIAEGKVQVQ